MSNRWRNWDKDPNQGKADLSLKAAFKHEVRPEQYLLRVWATAIVIGGYFSYMAASSSGHFDINIIVPLGGWHGHDPYGGVYMETWGNILVNALQGAFVIWGAVLIFLGFYRVFSAHKYVFACFYLGIAFLGFAWVLPSWTETLLKMLIEKCPLLVQ